MKAIINWMLAPSLSAPQMFSLRVQTALVTIL